MRITIISMLRKMVISVAMWLVRNICAVFIWIIWFLFMKWNGIWVGSWWCWSWGWRSDCRLLQ